jgi:hypothetical protein
VVGDSKILTVSYGTFSCTLEGFDDPFNTMTAIAEYFRDLAAGDRFFGAEPPQPDTEMLHKIAEQTIQKRVDASVTENSMILRQADSSSPAPGAALALAGLAGGAAAAANASPTAEAPAPAPTPVQEPRAEIAEDVAPEPSLDLTPDLTPGAGSDFGAGNTVAEKLQRIRAVVDQDAVVVPYAEDQHVDDRDLDEATSQATTDHPMFEDASDAEDSNLFDDVSDEYEDEAAYSGESSFEDASDDVVSEDDAQDDEVQDDANLIASLTDSSEPEPEYEAEAVAEDSIEAETEIEDEAEAEVEIEAVADTAADDEAEADAEDAVGALLGDTQDDEYLEDLEALDATSEADDSDTLDADAFADADYDGEADAEIAPRRAFSVEKVSRSDLEAANGYDDAFEAEDEDLSAQADDEGLSAEAEEALRDELEAVEFEDDMSADDSNADDQKSEDDEFVMADILATDDTDEDENDSIMGGADDDADETRAARLARRSVPTEDEDAALERLMNTTSSRLDNDESSVRRASIAHLKAAVAATKADSSLAPSGDKEEAEKNPYREDLARVVRPGRPTASGSDSERPSTSRPAPLVLVSEQRIETEEASEDGAAVSPRRISKASLEDFVEDEDSNIYSESDAQSFVAYASEMDALELPDLLEAAAAHYMYVEGAEHFTRPMLMRKIASISNADDFSREEGLRSFGTLLREGKIVKHDNGKFVIAKTSRFTPEARFAGE